MGYEQFTAFAGSPLLLKLVPAVFVFSFALILSRKDEENAVFPFLAGAILLAARDVVGYFIPYEDIYLVADVLFLVIFGFTLMYTARRKTAAFIFLGLNALFLLLFSLDSFLRFLPARPFAFNQAILFVDVALIAVVGLVSAKDMESLAERFASRAWMLVMPFFFVYAAVAAIFGYLSPVTQYIAMPALHFGPFFALFSFVRIYENRLIREQERLEETIDMTYSFVERSGDAFKSSVDLAQLLDYVIQSVVDQVRADGGILFLVDEFDDVITVRSHTGYFPPVTSLPEDLPRKENRVQAWTNHMNFKIGESVFGEVAKTGKYVFIENAATDSRVTVNGDEDYLRYGSLIIVPLMVSGRIIGVISVVRKDAEDVFEEREFERVRLLSDFGALIINTLFSFIETSEKNEIEQEAGIAQEIQKTIIPKKLPTIDMASFGAFSLPARGVCGDYYDVIRPRKDRLILTMGDVAGKGIQASLVMVMIRSILNLIANSDKDTATILSWVNRGITGKIDLDHFATLALLSLDLSTGTAEYSNASHQPMLIFHKGIDSIETVDMKSLPIGVERGNQYEKRQFKLENGDIVVMYTDGIVEAMNPQGRQYGRKSLGNAIKANHELSAKDIASKVKNDLQEFVGKARQHDDQSLLVMKISV